ncbi:MAG: hypothetical protein IPK85_09100 [Gemmatimonadetes bacterium]|nr:hypothetical protein [Gemmatimonadota bacterium]
MPPIEPKDDIRPRLESEARWAAAWRTFAVVCVYVVLEVLWPESVQRLPLHIFLALAGAWAIRIGETGGGPVFERADHSSKFLGLPMLIGGVLTLLDLWALVSPS